MISLHNLPPISVNLKHPDELINILQLLEGVVDAIPDSPASAPEMKQELEDDDEDDDEDSKTLEQDQSETEDQATSDTEPQVCRCLMNGIGVKAGAGRIKP